MNQPPKNPQKRRLRVEVFFAFVLVLLGVYVAGYVYTHVLRADVEQMRIEMGYADQPTGFNGIIIRDEAVYRSPHGGNLTFRVQELRRVRAGQEVANGVAVSRPGIVSFHVDGFENTFTPDTMGNIPRNAMEIQLPESDEQDYEQAPQAQNSFRVVRGNDWFIASYVPMIYAQNWHVDLNITIFINDGDELIALPVMVYRLLHSGNDAYVVLRTNFEVLRFINHRTVTFQLQQNPVQGLRVPASAIVELSTFPVPRDFVQERYRMMTVDRRISDNETAVEPVAGWTSSDGTVFYILADGSNLRVGDTISNDGNPFVLGFIQTVPGVFVANRGHAVFRQITLPLQFGYNETDFVILNPANNPYIHLFDWIVVDGQNVDNRLLLH
ncbi:MAG: hypothetical protein FWE21_03750 [Defluviitaleaceae bacterium]|nr:hypothetical protein [Defluviitaleaceae bacterium]